MVKGRKETGVENRHSIANTLAEIVGDVFAIPEWFVGQPEFRSDNEGWGQWENTALQAKFKDSHDINRQFRYGNWSAHLNGGPQASGESWASISIPINELKVKDLQKIEYVWYKHVTGTSDIGALGPNLVFSAYDANDHSKRVDFNTLPTGSTHPANPTAGWHQYTLTDFDKTEFVYWYGNSTGTHDQVPTEGAQDQYFWSDYVADLGFREWVIYRIQITSGYWSATRSTGDVWIGSVRINDTYVRWEPSEAEKIEIAEKEKNMFGAPSLTSRGNSKANWDRGSASPYDQKGSTGWLAALNGGLQSAWDDYARVNIPVNEMHVPDLKTALWSYYMTTTDSFGVNMVIFVHDPFNLDNRAEITQIGSIAGLAKGAGWNAHALNPSTDQFFFYGENTTKTNLTPAAPNYYGWDDFVADELFNTWTIYKITFDFGWQNSGTFGVASVADIVINGQLIKLGPPSGKHRKIVVQTKILDANAAYTAFDVISETPSASAGTDWDFDFGGTGIITNASIHHPTTANTAGVSLFLYSRPPTCELDDHAASNQVLAADAPYFLGVIEFPVFTDDLTNPSRAVVSTSTTGNLPIIFDTPIIYGVTMTRGGFDYLDDTLLTIILGADMED